MVVVSSKSKTAAEMRDDIVNSLQRRVELAKKATEPYPGRTQKNLSFSRGYAAALTAELDFWQNLLLEGEKPHDPA